MRCDICRKQIAETFLKKIVGTLVRDAKGKVHPVCFECQGKFREKDKMLSALD
ncbi:hypothetical protein HYY72_01205 [Candidatus Woesearchaeota archaeon]|nr:hypothetical protein [Candidatus Woesearchaeota archaeon]